jgi:N-acetylglucosaminyldiphosphoundecaprenol N-acetyl-beta-D-mannosaminyltransferase
MRRLPQCDCGAFVPHQRVAPDIVRAGSSTAKQEFWMASFIGRLNAPVLVGVGAAFDFLAGTQAPVWMQRSGLEWTYRLAHEPRSLWKRYARIVPLFFLLALAQIIVRRVAGIVRLRLKKTTVSANGLVTG